MKRRILSLLLAMSLLVTLLPLPSVAEEVMIEEVIESEEALPEEVPAEEAPVEEVPDEEETPAEDAPEEEPPVEETPAEDVPEEELPVEEILAEEIPAEEPPVEEVPIEEEPAEEPEVVEEYEVDESLVSYALGSDGVQYAGVKYLSQAAYDSMPADSQDAYIEMVDELNSMLDEGVVIYDPVFFLKSDGKVGCAYQIHTETVFEDGNFEISEVEPEEAPVEAEPIEAEPVEDAPAEPEPAPETSEAEEPGVCIEENVELAERMRPSQRNAHVRAGAGQNMAMLEGALDMQQFNSTFWKNKDFFEKQLSSAEKRYFGGLYNQFVERHYSYYWARSSKKGVVNDMHNAFSAVLDTCPQAFDWIDIANQNFVFYTEYDDIDRYWIIEYGPDTSRYYTDELEEAAQAKVEELVEAAYEYAKGFYPQDIIYEMVHYFDDWICKHSYYSDAGGKDAPMDTREYYYCHSSYGVLLKGYGVCESYARTMGRLLDAAGIPNLYATQPGHAYNYVQMPNGKFYLVDSTFNDTSGNEYGLSSMKYLLCSKDSRHSPDGSYFFDNKKGKSLKKFKYPALAPYEYIPNPNDVVVVEREESRYLAVGESQELANSGEYFQDMFGVEWSNSNPEVASLKDGVLKGLKPGTTELSQTYKGETVTCEIHVYEIAGLSIQDNHSAKLSDICSGLGKSATYNIDVLQKGTALPAGALEDAATPPTLTVSKPEVADASAVLVGETIVLTVVPRKIGETTVTVGFGGKSAKLTLKMREEMDEDWFSLEYDETTYNGKAQKPKVIKEAGAPSDLKYSVKYSDNVNAGDGIVTITGKNGYGALEKYFLILPATIEDEVKITDPKPQVYSGAPLSAAATVKLGKKKLKAGTDYEIWYDYDEEVPVDAGTYSLYFEGKNYAGSLSDYERHEFTIQPAPLTKVKMSLKKSSVKKDGTPVTAETLGLQVKIGKNEVPEEEYEISYRDKWGDEIYPPTEPGSYTLVLTPVGDNIEATAKKRELTKGFKIKK